MFAVSVFAVAGEDEFIPQKLTVGEFFENPVGMSLENLRFSWRMPAGSQGMRQTAYQLVVARTPEGLGENPLWDSGKSRRPDSVWVAADIPAPKSRERFYWKVRVWDEAGRASGWSEPAFFEAGLLDNSDWSAQVDFKHRSAGVPIP